MSDSFMDDNIVKMTFDNKQFEQNAKQSLDTIEKLKSSMNFEASVKGLDKIEKSINKTNKSLGDLSGAVDKINKKFNALGIMGKRALENITDSIYMTSKRMIKALTIDPIKQGFEEYELKMQSVQTIMASTGASVKEVNQYLDELNTYSDKTIYSFKDMTSNIGKFTNAGVALKDAVAAIQGISNVAAVAGANTNEASRAMYNFSQALSAGYVKLIDWKSIELANMATKEFKENLISVAEGLGTIKKVAGGYQTVTKDLNGKISEVFTATKNFNDSLSHQWMTNDVLNKTLAIYSTDLTEITEKELNEYKVKTKNNELTKKEALVLKKKEFEADLKQLGLTDKKIKQMEALSKKAFRAATEVKTWSQLFDTLKEAVGSGWAKTYEYIFGDKDEATKMLTRVNNVVSAIIDKNAELRNSILFDWHNYGGYEALVGKNGIFANIKRGIDSVIKPIHNAWYTAFPIADNLGKKLSEITKSIRDFTSTLKLSEEDSKNLQKTFSGLFMILKTGKDIIVDITTGVGKLIGISSKGFGALLSGLLKFTSKLGHVGQEVEYLYRVVKTIIVYTNEYFKITDTISNIALSVFRILTQILGGALIGAIKSIIAGSSIIYNVLKSIYGIIGPILQSTWDALAKHKGIIETIVALIKTIPELIKFIAKSIDQIFEGKQGKSVGSVKDEIDGMGESASITSNLINGLVTALSNIGSIVKTVLREITPGRVMLALFAASTAYLTAAVGKLIFSISMIPDMISFKLIPECTKLIKNISSITEAIRNRLFPGLGNTKLKFSEFAQSTAILVLALTAMYKVMSSLSTRKIVEISASLTGMMGVFVGLYAATALLTNKLSKLENSISADDFAKSMLVVSASLLLISRAFKVLDSIKNIRGLMLKVSGISAVILATSLAIKMISRVDEKGKKLYRPSGLMMLSFAVSLKIMARAIGAMSEINPNKFKKNLGNITVWMEYACYWSST